MAAGALTSVKLNGSKLASGPCKGSWLMERSSTGICLCRIRLGEARRRAGKTIQPRCSIFKRSVRAAMSLSWPVAVRQFHSPANS